MPLELQYSDRGREENGNWSSWPMTASYQQPTTSCELDNINCKNQPLTGATYFLWNRTTLSASRSLSSSLHPFSMTSGCLRTSSQPMWAKKKPRTALWGSASVSEYLWWTLWSRAHSKISFCGYKERRRLHTQWTKHGTYTEMKTAIITVSVRLCDCVSVCDPYDRYLKCHGVSNAKKDP